MVLPSVPAARFTDSHPLYERLQLIKPPTTWAYLLCKSSLKSSRRLVSSASKSKLLCVQQGSDTEVSHWLLGSSPKDCYSEVKRSRSLPALLRSDRCREVAQRSLFPLSQTHSHQRKLVSCRLQCGSVGLWSKH